VPSQQQPQCSDGVDNDSDGAVDRADPGCLSGAKDSYDSTDANEGDEGLQDLFLCGKRQISLVRADVQGKRVMLSGIVGESVANQRVELSVRYLKSKRKPESLGAVRADRNGLFKARVKRPPNALFTVARYRAKIGKARSVELKLPQSLASTSLRSRPGGMLEVRGQVDRTLLGKRRHPVVIKRIVCGRYRTVGQATPNASGVYVVRFAAPAIASAALYRAETKVLARPGSKRFVRQFARALGITF
jgi:hypothetical protein